MGRQSERTERSTRALLGAAALIIDEEGLQALTVARIGERAGYSRGMVTERCGSKEALLGALLDTILSSITSDMASAMAGKSGVEQVDVYLAEIARQGTEQPNRLRVLAKMTYQSIGLDPELSNRFALANAYIRHNLAGLVRAGIADGSIRPDADPDNEAVMIVAMFRGVGYQWCVDPNGVDAGAALRYAHEVTVDRLASASVRARAGAV